MTQTELISAVMRIGHLLLENGAEIYRVEESMQRVCYAYGVADAEVFAVPTTIILTISGEGEPPLTRAKRIYTRGTNLYKMEQLNSLCRKLCAETPPYDTVMGYIQDIDSALPYPQWMQILAFAVISFFFTLFFGGGIQDALGAFAIGALLEVLVHSMEQVGSSPFFINVLGGTLTATLALAVSRMGLATDKVIIGTIMTLVPGIELTISMRDVITGDFVAGLAKLTEALLAGAGIAVGVSIPMFFLQGVL